MESSLIAEKDTAIGRWSEHGQSIPDGRFGEKYLYHALTNSGGFILCNFSPLTRPKRPSGFIASLRFPGLNPHEIAL